MVFDFSYLSYPRSMFDVASICLVILPVIVLYGLALQWGFNLIWFKGPAWLVMPPPAGWSVAPSPSLPGFFQSLIICPLCFYSAFKSSDAPELLPSSFVFGIHLVSFSMRLVCCSSLYFIHFSVFFLCYSAYSSYTFFSGVLGRCFWALFLVFFGLQFCAFVADVSVC